MKKTNLLLCAALISLTSCDNDSETPINKFADNKPIMEKVFIENREAFQKGNFEEIFEILSADNPEAKGHVLNVLGVMHHFGYGVKTNFNQARILYEQAAKLGNGEAANHLARLYNNGEGVKQDRIRAKESYKLSCDNGYNLGCTNYETIKKFV